MGAHASGLRCASALLLLVVMATSLAVASEPPSAESVLLDSDASTELFASADLIPSGLIRGGGNIAMVSQAGLSGNTANVAQSDTRNVAITLQRSDGGINQSTVNQNGSSNIAINLQTGSENESDISQFGENNLAISEQFGADNSLVHQQIGDHLGLVVRQYGESQISITQTNFSE